MRRRKAKRVGVREDLLSKRRRLEASSSRERSPSTRIEDPELDKELAEIITSREKELVDDMLAAPTSQVKLKEQIRKAYANAIDSLEYRDMALLMNKEHDKVVQYVLDHTGDIRDKLEEIELSFQSMLSEKNKQVETMDRLELEYKEQRREYYELLGIPDPEFVAEQERLKIEEEARLKEQERLKEEQRWRDEARRLKEEAEKKPQVPQMTFTTFGR